MNLYKFYVHYKYKKILNVFYHFPYKFIIKIKVSLHSLKLFPSFNSFEKALLHNICYLGYNPNFPYIYFLISKTVPFLFTMILKISILKVTTFISTKISELDSIYKV